MSVITKDLASSIANKLTEKKQKEIDKLTAQFERKVMDEYQKQVPAALKRIDKTTPGYILKTKTVVLNGHGWSYEHVSVPEHVIRLRDNSNAYLDLTSDFNKEITKIYNHIGTLKEDRTKVRQEIISALLSLRTYKRIEASFKEAFELLPVSTSTALVVNIDDIRRKLK